MHVFKKKKKQQEFNFFLVTFIYSDYSHFQYKLMFFFYMTGPRVPKKPQFTHELVK
jgi:hypothetical protein